MKKGVSDPAITDAFVVYDTIICPFSSDVKGFAKEIPILRNSQKTALNSVRIA